MTGPKFSFNPASWVDELRKALPAGTVPHTWRLICLNRWACRLCHAKPDQKPTATLRGRFRVTGITRDVELTFCQDLTRCPLFQTYLPKPAPKPDWVLRAERLASTITPHVTNPSR